MSALGAAELPRQAGFENGWWRAAVRMPSPNRNARPQAAVIDLIVIHSISLPPGEFETEAVCDLFLNRLDCDANPYFDRLRELKVSAHFVIWRDGQVTQFVSVDDRAWHAGASSYRGRDACNDDSIGIEMQGLEGGDFTPLQMATLVELCASLCAAWPIRYIAGHEHIAPLRKADPGPGFGWNQLQQGLAHGRLQWPARQQNL